MLLWFQMEILMELKLVSAVLVLLVSLVSCSTSIMLEFTI